MISRTKIFWLTLLRLLTKGLSFFILFLNCFSISAKCWFLLKGSSFVPLVDKALNFKVGVSQHCFLSCHTRKKVIELDDLVSEHYKEQSKLIDKGNRKRKASSKLYDSDDDDERGQEALLSIVDDCRNQACLLFKFQHFLSSLFFSSCRLHFFR